MATPAAEFIAVSKHYSLGAFARRHVQAVEEASFSVPAGQVFGLLGPNRAGKTTLVKLLLSLCRATSGEIRRLGQGVGARSTLARVGYMHENQAFPRYLTAPALLEYYGALTHVPPETVRKRVPELLERVGIADRAQEPIAGFSKGMVQRLALAQALINDPELLVLDEPAEGLDLPGRSLLQDVIRNHKRQGRTVILVSHVLPEVERLCDQAAVIVAGRIVFSGSIATLVKRGSGDRTLEQALQEMYQKNSPCN